MMPRMLKRIFGDKPFPDGLSREQLNDHLNERVKAFEESGFLEQTAFPSIKDEDEFISKLQQHRNEVMVVKYWKRSCLPCLSLAEMYKAAEQTCLKEKRPVSFYSVDIKSKDAASLVAYQLVEGTPTIQTFVNGKQVGEEITAMTESSFLSAVLSRVPHPALTPAPGNSTQGL